MSQQAILLVGIPASGKSTFYKARFADTHLRINLDMLKNRNRENAILQACLLTQTSFVVDNTNINSQERRKYIKLAKLFGFEVHVYYFDPNVEKSQERNQHRKNNVPDRAITSRFSKYEMPEYREGVTKIYRVDDEFNCMLRLK